MSSETIRSRIAQFIAIALSAILAGTTCRHEPAAVPAQNGGTQSDGRLIRRLNADVNSLNPVLMSTGYEREVLTYLFDGLIEIDSKLMPAPGVAVRWEITPDGRTYKFFLDPKATFEDGTPVTSSDVVFSLRKYAEDSALLSGYLIGIDLKKTRAIDTTTVEVVFDRAKAGQLYAFGFAVLPEHVYSKGNFKEDFNDRVIGNGPYRLVRRNPGSEIQLVRREDYAGVKPPLREIVFKVIPNDTVAWSALVRGEIDEMRISTEQWELYASDPEVRKAISFVQFYELGYTFIAWNNEVEPLDDPAVRRALTMAIDRAAVVTHVHRGGARVMTGPFTVEQWAFNPAVPPIPFDPASARKALEAAGWRDANGDGILSKGQKPLRIELLVDAEAATTVEQGPVYQQALRAIGVDLVLTKLEGTSLIERVLSGKYQAVFLAYSLDLDPDPFANFHSSQFPPEGQNWVYYSNPEVDDLLTRARDELDQNKRREIYYRLHEILSNEQPYTWLVQPSTRWAISRRVQNVEVAPGLGLFYWIPGPRAWWVPRTGSADVQTGG